jgi:hypothetical protein
MRAWCPRCDAVRPGATTCPVCATPLATLDDAAPTTAREPDLPPPQEDPAPPPAPSRLRIALAAATLVVAGLAFVAGRSVARPAAPAATTAAPATSTTTPEPGADFRRLGWTARRGKVTVTAVKAERVAVAARETVAQLTFRIQGLPAGQRLLALRGLRLLDSGGGVFASVDRRQLGEQNGGVPVRASGREPGVYTVVTGPAPRLSALARIELAGLLAVRPGERTIVLDTAGPWPSRPPLRTVVPGAEDGFRGALGFNQLEGVDVVLRVMAAFVGGGRAVVVVDASSGYLGMPGDVLPLTAELRAGDRVLCSRTALLGEETARQYAQGIVVACPTRPVPRLTVALGVGVATVPFDADLRP